jgi:hypothetical protein
VLDCYLFGPLIDALRSHHFTSSQLLKNVESMQLGCLAEGIHKPVQHSVKSSETVPKSDACVSFVLLCGLRGSWNRTVGIATSYGLDD